MIDTLHQSEPVMVPGRPFGQRARSVAAYALLTALMMITPMLVFVPAALFHCAIRNGRRAAGATAALSLTLAALYMAAVPVPAPHQAMNLAYLLMMALSVIAPSIAMLPMLLRGERFGRMLVFLLIGATVGLLLTELTARAVWSVSPYGMQVENWQQQSAATLEFYRANGAPADALRTIERWSAYTAQLVPAGMLIMLAFVFVLSLLMLGRLRAWHQLAATRPDKEALGAYLFRNLSLPDWTLFAFVVGGLTPLASGMLQKVAANTLAVVAFLFILQGLAIFRFLLVAMGAGFAGTMLGWLLLAFLTLTGVAPLLLGVAGLFDPFFDFRHFKKRKDDSHESHSD
jgi:hypothetical protein